MHAPTKYVGLCCTSVGISTLGSVNMLARVALCDYWGQDLFTTFVQPTAEVTNYRTSMTGITAAELTGASSLPFNTVQQKVAELIEGKILVGYCIWMDLSVLGLAHPNSHIRDVALYVPFRHTLGSLDQIVRLPTMMWMLMRRRIGESTHNPAEDAYAVIDLFRSAEPQWEGFIDQLDWPCYLPPNSYRACFL
ncbi:hypothetical protein CPB86DRAFT_806577 [Serendipita vermifera]|nr:hypothetical protein CPB86DRAFT_806577 [Serendipita vermifera]